MELYPKTLARYLKRLAPLAYEARARDTLDRTNPVPYCAPCFSYKTHMNQNENIAQGFGRTHVALIDGCSRMICGYASVEVKNPILIYEYIFRPAILKYGLWNQLRIDHGQEFSLCIFVQDLLKNYRQGTEKEPRKQTISTQNNAIERFWPGLNSRVNYPVKRALSSIFEENDYNMSDPVLKYFVLWISNYICQGATQHLIKSWNHHRTPGPMRCISFENMRQSQQNAPLNEVFVPSASEAVRMYE